MKDFQHILVPIDFGESSNEALDLAMGLADKFGAALSVVHAYEMPVYPYDGAFLAAPEWAEAIENAAKGKLDEVLATVRAKLPRANGILRAGPAAVEILAAASEHKADLIVMGTHGRHGLERALIGSVAERVVRLSPVPVLVARPRPGRSDTNR
jgi:nucleotide-binding universal stress UspA family protein